MINVFLCPLHGKIKPSKKIAFSHTKWLSVYVWDVSREVKKKKISLTFLYRISMGCISKTLIGGTHYLYVHNNDSGAAESRTPAQWHKAPETLQHKLTSISARNVHFKGSAEQYGATIAAVRECSSTRRLYLQSAMPHPTAEVRAGGNECPHHYVWRL